MEEILDKQYGPFDGKTWAIILVAGIGLGLLVRRSSLFGGDGSANDDPEAYTVGSVTPAIVGSGTDYNEEAIIQGVVDRIGPMTNTDNISPPVTPNPSGVTVDDFVTETTGGDIIVSNPTTDETALIPDGVYNGIDVRPIIQNLRDLGVDPTQVVGF